MYWSTFNQCNNKRNVGALYNCAHLADNSLYININVIDCDFSQNDGSTGGAIYIA